MAGGATFTVLRCRPSSLVATDPPKLRSTIEPTISNSLSLQNHVTKRGKRIKRVSNPHDEEGFALASISLSLRVKLTDATKGASDGGERGREERRRGRSLKRENGIRIERERERRTLNADTDTVASQSPLVRVAHENPSLRFLLHFYERVTASGRFRARSPSAFPSTVHLVQRSRRRAATDARYLRQRANDTGWYRGDSPATCERKIDSYLQIRECKWHHEHGMLI